jgi:hypothetical protein
MGRQWNQIIESLGPLTGGTVSINANLGEIDALLTTIQADLADGIPIDNFSSFATGDTPNRPDLGVQLGYWDAGDGSFNRAATTQPFPIGLRDSSGNIITSTTIGTKVRLDVNLSSAGTTGSAVPTTANLYAGTDGTNLRAISVDTTGKLNVNLASSVRGTTTIGTLTAGTTNGTLFATNSTRNYLLVQCTSGTVFIDTNGTATTADGIQLTSGQGITFEGNYIPTGAIAAITSTGTARLIGRQG